MHFEPIETTDCILSWKRFFTVSMEGHLAASNRHPPLTVAEARRMFIVYLTWNSATAHMRVGVAAYRCPDGLRLFLSPFCILANHAQTRHLPVATRQLQFRRWHGSSRQKARGKGSVSHSFLIYKESKSCPEAFPWKSSYTSLARNGTQAHDPEREVSKREAAK